MYNVFISYRKKSSVNADLIRKSIAESTAYSLENIFLDKHSIGPELFDDKIKCAIASSNCIVLLVTKDCFKTKDHSEEDWFYEEIRTAISLGKKIIPVLFDKIDSLSEASILDDLNKILTPHEVDIIIKSQSVPYSTDFPDASITKLVHFIEEANETQNVLEKTLRIIKGIGIVLVALAVFFAMFFGIGVLWGYFTSSIDSDSVLADNTIIEGNSLHFEYRGWEATYDVINDTILIDIKEYTQKPKVSNVDLVLSSFTFTGAKLLLEKNLSYIKYMKFLRGGSKQAKVAFVCASAAACAGAFCGFSQGSSFGQSKRQEETALMLYPKLQQRATWHPIIKKNVFLKSRYLWWESVKAPNCISIGSPYDSTGIAYKAGLKTSKVLLKYNDWEIGSSNYLKLMEEIDVCKEKDKLVVFLSMEDLSIKEFHLPQGTVGISFQPGDGNQGRYEIAIEKLNEWKQQHDKR